MAEQTKCCEICTESFKPNPRVGDRQGVCSKLSCQQERKRRSREAWVKQNPDYFKGRYPNTKEWLEAHPGYLQTYRQQRRANVRRDIQDELTSCYRKHLPNVGTSLDAYNPKTWLIP